MKRLLTVAALALSLALSCTVSAAKDITYKSGRWTVYKTVGDKGTPMCGMHQTWSNATVHFKFIFGSPGVHMHIIKLGWQFPKDSILVPIKIGFDSNPEWLSGTADTNITKDGHSLLSTVIGKDNGAIAYDFLSEFGEANNMFITFGGNEPQWKADMIGSRNATKMLLTCLGVMAKENTQPFDQGSQAQAPQGTQPFDSKPTAGPEFRKGSGGI